MTLKTCTCGALSKCEEAAADLLRERDELQSRLDLNLLDSVSARCAELKAENERLRKDAERYRWLRDQDKSTAFFVGGVCVTIYPVYPDVQTLDAAVDTAMEAERDSALDELAAIGQEIGDYD